MQSAAILIVGDEILSGEIADENGPYLLRVLTEAGVRVERIIVVPDRREAIVGELRRLRAIADAVVISGGIGPTHDDVTRPAVAEAVGCELEPHAEAEARVRGFYADRITDSELAMARMPKGSALLDGARTKTFGFQVGGVFSLPGVPALFRDIAGRLPEAFAARRVYREALETTRREGEIAPFLSELQDRSPDVAIGSYPLYEDGRWRVRVVLRGTDASRVEETARILREGIA